jgi:hypothetical protein
MERMEEGFRILSRLPLPTRPKGYVNSRPIYLYDQADLNSQLETYELERLARMRNRVRILPSPAEIARMEEALHWPAAFLSGVEFHHLARAVNLGALWAAFDVDLDRAIKRIKLTRRTFNARKLLSLAAGVLACALCGCTSMQQAQFQTQFQSDVAAFNNDVALIDSTIAAVSSALANNCAKLAATGQALAALVGTSSAAGAGLNGVDATIVSYCQAHPTDVTSAISATAVAISAGKAARAAAKAGN